MALPPLVVNGSMQGGPQPDLPEVEVPVDMPMDMSGGVEMIPTPDGGMEIMSPEMMEQDAMAVAMDHNANLAEFVDEAELGALASELVALYEDDLQSRSQWEETYEKGLSLLGIEHEERTTPFEGASGVTHPLISESVTQFQAQAYKELLPAGGPVRGNIVGLKTPEKEAQAARVKDFMNYQIMEVMDDYDPGMDQMLFYLPLSGSTFKKVYYDVVRDRAVSEFVPAQDLVVPYSATHLQTTPRATHRVSMSDNDVRKLQVAGIYLDIDLPDAAPGDDDPSRVDDKVDKIQGTTRGNDATDRLLLEAHVELDLPGFEDADPMTGEPTGIKLPYIVTIDYASNKVLAVRRNWAPTDPLKRKRQYFVHYKFMPGLGFYGFGLIHMIGGLGRAATSLLRQLIDAGTLANLPGGFKAKGIRVRDSDQPIAPGEWRDIDAPGGNLRDSVIPLPYKEPSATLATLLGALIDAGRRFVSVADQMVPDTNREMPVGTTIALLERGTRVMSAIHKRLHYAQKTEFRLLAKIFAENLPPEYPYEVSGAPSAIKASDFDERVDVVPVSDPNIFSMAQRIALAQNQLQLAQSNPQMHNLREAYRRMYQALEVQNIDEILPPPPPPPQPMDPAMENAAIVNGQAPQAFPQQDHEAHLEAHIAMTLSPLVAQTPMVMAPLFSHCLQHVSLLAREKVDEELSRLQQEQPQAQMQQVMLMAQTGAIDPMTARMQMQQIQPPQFTPEQIEARVAQVQQELMAEVIRRMSPNPAGKDPLVDIRMRELQLKEQKDQMDAMIDQQKLAEQRENRQQRALETAARLELQEQVADDRNEVNRDRIELQRQSMLRRGN